MLKVDDLRLKDPRLPDSPDMVRRREDNGTPLLCLSVLYKIGNWYNSQWDQRRKKFKTHGEVREFFRNSSLVPSGKNVSAVE
jgi:hypothetical protein